MRCRQGESIQVRLACRIEAEESLPRPQLLESQRIAKCLLSYIARHHDQVAPLFDLLAIFSQRTRVDFTFVVDFYRDVVAETYTAEEKHQVRRSHILHGTCVHQFG